MRIADMREIIFKDLTGTGHMKKDISICEVVETNGCVARMERRCIYFVCDKISLKDKRDLEMLKSLKKRDETRKKKHVHIFKSHDSVTGEDRLSCKIAGTLYAIIRKDVFSIAFVHSFRIDLHAVSADKKKT